MIDFLYAFGAKEVSGHEYEKSKLTFKVLHGTQGQDITGFEFCFLLRRRQERRNAAVPAVILMGRDREALVQSDPDTTGYVLEPCLDAEIVWPLERHSPNQYTSCTSISLLRFCRIGRVLIMSVFNWGQKNHR
jgi:hypothetical protein